MPKPVFRRRKGSVCAGRNRPGVTRAPREVPAGDALPALRGSGLDPRRERLITSR